MIFPEVKINTNQIPLKTLEENYILYLNKENNNLVFNHDKVSVSRKNVLRGLHGDSKSWKLITCLAG